MAKLYWFGKTANLSISNKATNCSGIATVTISATSTANWAFSTTATTMSTSVTNPTTNGSASIASFALRPASGATSTLTYTAANTSVLLTWYSPDNKKTNKSDIHNLNTDITLCREANLALVSIGVVSPTATDVSTSIWSDTTSYPTLYVGAKPTTGTMYATNTAITGTFASSTTTFIGSQTSANHSYAITTTGAVSASINKSVPVKFTVSTSTSSTPSTTAPSLTATTAATATVTILNAVKSITVGDTTTRSSDFSIWIPSGTNTTTINYLTNAHHSGTVFSTATTVAGYDSKVISVAATTATLSGYTSAWAITALPAGDTTTNATTSTQFTIHSTLNAKGSVDSVKITAYITDSTVDFVLPAGDACTYTFPTLTTYPSISTASTSTSIGAATLNTTTHVLTLALTSAASAGSSYTCTLSNGLKFRVTCQHVNITLS